MPDENLLRSEVDPCNQPVFVTFDVENSATTNLIRFRPGLSNMVKVSPRRLFRHSEPDIERARQISVFCCRIHQLLTADYPHSGRPLRILRSLLNSQNANLSSGCPPSSVSSFPSPL